MLRTAIITVGILSSAMAHSGVFKCTAPDGTLTFSDKPCPGQATEELDIKTPAQEERERRLKIEQERAERIAAVDSDLRRRQIEEGKVGVGMTPEQVRLSWGNPDDINRTVADYGTREQWVYERGGTDRQYVYFRDDVVSSISSN